MRVTRSVQGVNELSSSQTSEVRDGGHDLLDRVLCSYTRPNWKVLGSTKSSGSEHADGKRGQSPKYDAAMVSEDQSPEEVAEVVGSLAELGRLIVSSRDDAAIDLAVSYARSQLSPIADLVAEDGTRVLVAEKMPIGGVGWSEPTRWRKDVNLGAYKMSRYRTYHAMQAAVVQMLPVAEGPPLNVIEIGDTNGVIRGMLGSGRHEYFQARYPEHDLQSLEKIESDSYDVFICDNTLEHVASPQSGIEQMHRVLRPGGWAILMLPYLAMSQDDDRMRFSPLALSEALRDVFPLGTMGSWGNVEAGCVYLRGNKWSRVSRVEWAEGKRLGECTMRCADSRTAGAPVLDVPCANDRQHAIHLWAVVRKAASVNADRLSLPKTSAFTTLTEGERDLCGRVALAAKDGGHVAVVGVRDGSLLDELKRVGVKAIGIDSDVRCVNHVRMRGLRAMLANGAGEPEAASILAKCRVVVTSGNGLTCLAECVGRCIRRNREAIVLAPR